MTEFPAGSPSFQLPRPHKGVVYAEESGAVYLMRDGQALLLWAPPKPTPINQTDED